VTQRPPRSITPRSGEPVPPYDPLRFPLSAEELMAVVRAALEEDAAFNDITTIATVVSDRRGHAAIVAREAGTIAGVPLAIAVFQLLDSHVAIRVDADDGQRVAAGERVMHLTGDPRALLSGERVALNFLQRLSGISTQTARYVEAVRGTGAQIVDTRKTTPGLRRLEKYAVRAGGGRNHRLDLSGMVMIKDNHLAAVDGDIALAVRRAREFAADGIDVEVECDTIGQVRGAVEAGADIIMLDNMSPEEMREAVALVGGQAMTEASGGITLNTVRKVAETGVDWISVGALTHSVRALDLAMEFVAPP
jgi:nicotinate-nucleotide pyrophosphorylase (carboxylating)